MVNNIYALDYLSTLLLWPFLFQAATAKNPDLGYNS